MVSGARAPRAIVVAGNDCCALWSGSFIDVHAAFIAVAVSRRRAHDCSIQAVWCFRELNVAACRRSELVHRTWALIAIQRAVLIAVLWR